MTERLYDDSTLLDFEAKVLSCRKKDGKYEIILDRSAFFPEGGGQPGDIGQLGKVKVLDTVDRAGETVHICSAPLLPGRSVRGIVDSAERLRRMQNHSGEHLLMGFIHKMTGFDNVGFHLGSSAVTLDLNGVITPEQLVTCEQQANEAIAADLPITISYPAPEELAKIKYRSKLETDRGIRLVTIQGVDVCACCAPHLSSTGKIGIIKVISAEHYKGGTRIFIICGLQALDLFRERMGIAAAVSRLLSAKPETIPERVQALLSENTELKKQLSAFEAQRTDIIISGLKNNSRRSFCVFTEALSAQALQKIANAAVTLTDGAAGIFCKNSSGYSYIIISNTLKLRELSAGLNSALEGKGGGSDKMLQGFVKTDENKIRSYFDELP